MYVASVAARGNFPGWLVALFAGLLGSVGNACAIGESACLRRPRRVVDMICAGCACWTPLKGAGCETTNQVARFLDICNMFSPMKIRNPHRKLGLLVTRSSISTLHVRSSQPGHRRFLPAGLCVLWMQDGMGPCIMHRFVSMF